MPSNKVSSLIPAVTFHTHGHSPQASSFKLHDSLRSRVQATFCRLSQHSTQVQICFFITVLQQAARADPMTTLLSLAVGSSMQSQMEAKLAVWISSPAHSLSSPPVPLTPRSRTNQQSLAFDSSLLFPDSANTLCNQATPPRSSHISAPISKPLTTTSCIYYGTGLERSRARCLGLPRFTRPGRGARQLSPTIHFPSSLGPLVHRAPTSRPLRQPSSPLSASRWWCTLDGLSPAMGDSRESMMITAPAHVPEVIDSRTTTLGVTVRIL